MKISLFFKERILIFAQKLMIVYFNKKQLKMGQK